MDLLKPLVRHVTYDLYFRRDGYRLGAYRRELAASQYQSSDELEAARLRRLREVLAAAFAGSPFYRRRFRECGFEPADLRSFSDLRTLPLLTKEDIRNHLFPSPLPGYTEENTVHKRTGGSTGIPLHVRMDYPAASFKLAATERHNSWAGLRPGERIAAVWGDTDRRLPWKNRIRSVLTDRAVYLDTLKFEPVRIDAFLAEVERRRARVLCGHAHSVFRLAEHVRSRGPFDLRLRSVITTAMVLTSAERKTIEEVFCAPVFNRYGCEELSIIASECEAHCGMHVFAEGLHVELIEDGDDLPRKLVITDLVNRAMPLIRYEIGDYGRAGGTGCPCGRRLPLLTEICGREADFLYAPDGSRVFGISVLDTFMIHIPGFKQVQIVQDAVDHLEFHVVRDGACSEDSLVLLRRDVEQVFGPRMRYDVRFVERIAQTERGKYRFSICRIGDDTARPGPR
jgi:phenylacetate-CoA ligase